MNGEFWSDESNQLDGSKQYKYIQNVLTCDVSLENKPVIYLFLLTLNDLNATSRVRILQISRKIYLQAFLFVIYYMPDFYLHGERK